MGKVLVVNDEAACRESLRLLLSLESFEVIVAADGEEAVAMGKDFLPDVLVVDWVLTGRIDGLQAAEALRAINPRMQVVVMTGYPSDDLETRVKAMPGFQYLAKPFIPAEMTAAVHKAAELAR